MPKRISNDSLMFELPCDSASLGIERDELQVEIIIHPAVPAQEQRQ